MLQSERNARNKQIATWRGYIEMVEYQGAYDPHIMQANPAGTTKECAECSVETDKPLWIGNTGVCRVESRQIETRMRRTTFLLAVFRNYV